MRRDLALLCAAVLVAGCSGATGEPDDPDAGTVTDAGYGDPTVLVGRFQVRFVAPTVGESGTNSDGFTSIVGRVQDGPSLSAIVWEEAAKEGDCRLVTPRVPFCATPCGGSAACVEDDTCKAYPASKPVGRVTVTGVRTKAGAATFTMDPIANSYQPPGDVELPFPAFAEDDVITVAAAGSTFANPFTIEARGIAPLVLSDAELKLETGSALALAWTPPGKAGLGTVHVKLDISHHGGSKGQIECDTEDDGALELPAALVSQLLALGVAGYPTIVVGRAATGSATISAGRVELVLSSDVERSVVIPGLESCTSDTQCTDGKTCQADLTCR